MAGKLQHVVMLHQQQVLYGSEKRVPGCFLPCYVQAIVYGKEIILSFLQ